MQEEWKDVPGYEGLYQASSLGRVRSLSYKNTGVPKILKYQLNNRGYCIVHLRKKGDRNGKTLCLHRIIAATFIANPNSLPCVNHKNGIKTDNSIKNLEWCTAKDNILHSINVLKTDRNLGRKIKVQCVETKKIYASYVEAQEDTGIPAPNIRAAAKRLEKTDGRGYTYISRTAGGFHWNILSNVR